jgi:hypothetical protein
VVNGALGGATGFAGIILTIWCTLRDWPPAEQRAVFQPVGVSVFLLTALFVGGTGAVDRSTAQLPSFSTISFCRAADRSRLANHRQD